VAGGAALSNMQGMVAANVSSGLYLSIDNTPTLAVPATGAVNSNIAARLDTKIDDGSPVTGSVFPAGAATCILGNSYNESNSANDCNLYVRIQG
jgi:hypothetical protein